MTWRDEEILGWVEGELTGEQRAAFERAMEGDAALSRLARGMRADRAALRDIAERERFLTPGGLGLEAIERAEREALMAPEGVAGWSFEVETRKRGWGVVRGLAMVAGLAVVVGGAGVVWQSGGFSSKPAAPVGGLMAKGSVPTDVAVEERGSGGAMLAAESARGAEALAAAEVGTGEEAQQAGFGMPLAGPVLAALEAMDQMPRASWSGRGFETVEVGGRTREMLADREPPRSSVAPASYEDALRLASLNGLALRVMATDPESVEAGVRALSARAQGVGSVRAATLRDGSLLMWVDVDGGALALRELLAAVQRPSGSEARAVFEPSHGGGVQGGGTMLVGMSGGAEPVSGAGQRVRVPVRIERASYVRE